MVARVTRKWYTPKSERKFLHGQSNPVVFVNAVGRRVRTVVQVMQSDGDKVIGKSTDEKQLVVKGYPPNPLSTFVEVIGIADNSQSIQTETWTNLVIHSMLIAMTKFADWQMGP